MHFYVVVLIVVAVALPFSSVGVYAQEMPGESSTPLTRYLASQADREAPDRDQVTRDVAAWQSLPIPEFLEEVEDLFSEREALANGSRKNTVKSLAAQHLLTSNVSDVTPATLGRLYDIGNRLLTSNERVSLEERVVASGTWSELGPAELLEQAANVPKTRKEVRRFFNYVAGKLAVRHLQSDDVIRGDPLIVGQLLEWGWRSFEPNQREAIEEEFLTQGAWSNLSASEFLDEFELIEAPNRSIHSLARAVAAKLMVEGDVSDLSQPGLLADLQVLARRSLSDRDAEKVSEKMLAANKLAVDASFADLEDWFELVGSLPSDLKTNIERRSQIAAWAEDHDLSALRSGQRAWLLLKLAPYVDFESNKGAVAVWSGKLTIPRDGEYRFSISPLDVNAEFGPGMIRQNYRVVLDGQTVIDTKPVDDGTATDWVWRAEPVSLRENQTVTVEFSLDYAYQKADGIQPRIAAPILFWEGERLRRQVVPPSAFQRNDGDPGVDFSMTWTSRGESQVMEGIDSNIESVWVNRCQLSYENKELRQRLAALLIADQSSPQALRQFQSGDPESHPMTGNGRRFQTPVSYLEAASNDARGDWIDYVCQSPEHFSIVELGRLYQLFQVARAGLEFEALDLIEAWAEQHENDTPILRDDGRLNRLQYERIGTHLLATEHEGAIEALEANALEDGVEDCLLPIAQICAYGYLSQGEILEWIGKLDAKLEDESIKGDKRVNWLIARAMAEEIRGCPAARRVSSPEQFLAGMGWLQEAMLVVQSPAIRARVVEEMVARKVVCGLDFEAERLLEAETAKLNGEDAAKIRDKWTQAIAKAKVLHEQKVAEEKRVSDRVVLAEMKRRQSSAAANGDEDAVADYNDRIEQLQLKTKEQ